MGKNRTITGFGPVTFTVTNSATSVASYSAWIRLPGPFIGNTVGVQYTFGTATSKATARLQGAMTTASTACWTFLHSARTGNLAGMTRATSTHIFQSVRLGSTTRGDTTDPLLVTAYMAVVP